MNSQCHERLPTEQIYQRLLLLIHCSDTEAQFNYPLNRKFSVFYSFNSLTVNVNMWFIVLLVCG